MFKQLGHGSPWAFCTVVGTQRNSFNSWQSYRRRRVVLIGKPLNNPGTDEKSEIEVVKLLGMEGNDEWDGAIGR